jgi:hypothetical protein
MPVEGLLRQQQQQQGVQYVTRAVVELPLDGCRAVVTQPETPQSTCQRRPSVSRQVGDM